MGLSRRLFTKEFKLAAVRRLEQGFPSARRRARWRSIPTCCTAGGGSSGPGQATRFRATESNVVQKGGLLNWKERSVSRHGRKVYPNLARTMVLTGMDQLWVADITYTRLREEFVFLAVIFSTHNHCSGDGRRARRKAVRHSRSSDRGRRRFS